MRNNWWPPAASVAIVGIGIGVSRSDGSIVISAALISLVLAMAGLAISRRKSNGKLGATNGTPAPSHRRDAGGCLQ